MSQRRLVEIRCGFAKLSRQEADAAGKRVDDARGAYDQQLTLVARITVELNPGASRKAKEAAQREFRIKIRAARAHSQVEMAASVWLEEINRINSGVRAEQTRIRREREAAERLAAELDRLTATAETSRTMAEAAEEACRAAQLGLAVPDGIAGAPANGEAAASRMEAQAGEQAASQVQPSPGIGTPTGPAAPEAAKSESSDAVSVASAPSPAAPATSEPAEVPAPPEPKIDFGGPRPPTIVRLLRRDRSAMNRLVEALAGDDVEQRRRWQLLLSNFVDSVVASAIDSGCFEFPPGNPFWDQFGEDEAREVARGLAALGFRYDGMSQFADGRVPEKRDLAMAVGQAGLYQVRVRYWPGTEEAAQLLHNARADTDVLLAQEAPSLTLGELVRLLGWRAALLADLWNEWPQVRPLLLAPSPI